jgi:predicted Fe-Mo cluster-binding NifX family protein
MKIAVTSQGKKLEDPVDSRFGRAANFLVFDTETNDFQVVDNTPNLNVAQGAGIQAAETLSRLGVETLITGHCGPNAFRVLSAAGIKVFSTDAPTVAAALERFRSGKLTEANSADVEGHWAWGRPPSRTGPSA